VAPKEVRAETLLWSARLINPTLDERVESTTALGHVNVQALHFMAAMHMSVRDGITFVLHVVAMLGVVAHILVASTKASHCEQIEILLICLVLIFQCLLDVEHKHASDCFQGVLDVLVKLPTGFRDGLLDQTLNKGLHFSRIAMSDCCQQIVGCGRSLQGRDRCNEQWRNLHIFNRDEQK